MSYHVFFSFSTGLKETLRVPIGTKAKVLQHIADVESALELVPERYNDNPAHWKRTRRYQDIDRAVLCRTVSNHNKWVRGFYDDIAKWAATPVEGGEEMTPADAEGFWHGLEILHIPAEFWTGEYYRERMEHLYEVMRGRDSEGVSFDESELSAQQAGAVIRLFSEFLDPSDLRLEVPKDHDYLASSYHGEYEWCSRCGAVTNEDADSCRQRGCPAQSDWCEDDQPLWYRGEDETDEAYEVRCRRRAEVQGWAKSDGSTDSRFVNESHGSDSDATSWTDLWLNEGVR